LIKKLFGKSKKHKKVSLQVCAHENDSPELRKLLSWFKDRGWVSEIQDWGIAGSQEIVTHKLEKDGVVIQLLFETYQGVTLLTTTEHEHLFNELRINT
jgi:hypothetical protein